MNVWNFTASYLISHFPILKFYLRWNVYISMVYNKLGYLLAEIRFVIHESPKGFALDRLGDTLKRFY
jgi:cytochrome c oxidase subunit IV